MSSHLFSTFLNNGAVVKFYSSLHVEWERNDCLCPPSNATRQELNIALAQSLTELTQKSVSHSQPCNALQSFLQIKHGVQVRALVSAHDPLQVLHVLCFARICIKLICCWQAGTGRSGLTGVAAELPPEAFSWPLHPGLCQNLLEDRTPGPFARNHQCIVERNEWQHLSLEILAGQRGTL